MNYSIPKEYTATGTLIVSVYTAGGAFPVEDALVIIRGSEQNSSGVLSVLYTDQSGNTPRITLPAPPAAESEKPGTDKPYATYNIEVDKENFYPRTFNNVPLFAGTTSIQPVNLIPLAEYNQDMLRPDSSDITESQNPDL